MKTRLDKFFLRIFHLRLTYKNINNVFLIMFLIGAAIAIAALSAGGSGFAGWIGVAMMIIFFALGFALKQLYWRCPDCGVMLPWKVTMKELPCCPGCGETLEWK